MSLVVLKPFIEAAAVLAVTAILSRLLPVIERRRLMHVLPAGRIALVAFGTTVAIWLLGISTIVTLSGLTTLGFFTVGSMGLALGAGVGGILADIFDGVYLLAEGHITEGDIASVGDGKAFRILDMRIRGLYVEDPENGDRSIIPNAVVFSSKLTRLSPASIAALPQPKELPHA